MATKISKRAAREEIKAIGLRLAELEGLGYTEKAFAERSALLERRRVLTNIQFGESLRQTPRGWD